MIVDKDSDRRRLRKMRTSLWVVLLIHVGAICAGEITAYMAVATMDALIFLAMISAVRRDIDALEVKLPEPATKSPSKENHNMFK